VDRANGPARRRQRICCRTHFLERRPWSPLVCHSSERAELAVALKYGGSFRESWRHPLLLDSNRYTHTSPTMPLHRESQSTYSGLPSFSRSSIHCLRCS